MLANIPKKGELMALFYHVFRRNYDEMSFLFDLKKLLLNIDFKLRNLAQFFIFSAAFLLMESSSLPMKFLRVGMNSYKSLRNN